MSREKFEYEAGKALSLPKNIIELARKGDGYDHAFDSMNIMQPLNGWWHWWKAGAASMQEERDQLAAENAAMKADQVRIFNSGYQRGHSATIEGYYVDIHRNDITTYHEDIVAEISEEQTPATDRFLADQRAIGVDMLVEECESDIMLIEPDDEEHYTLMIEHAKEFAAQLRNEVNV